MSPGTDITAELQQAINAGGTINIPAGVFTIGRIDLRPCIIRGAAWWATILKLKLGGGFVGRNFDGLKIEGLQIIGPDQDAESNWRAGKTYKDFTTVGLDLHEVNHATLADMYIQHCGNRGFSVEKCYQLALQGSIIAHRNGLGFHGYSTNAAGEQTRVQAYYNFIGTQNMGGKIDCEANLFWNSTFGMPGFTWKNGKLDCPQVVGTSYIVEAHYEQAARAQHAGGVYGPNGPISSYEVLDGKGSFSLGDALIHPSGYGEIGFRGTYFGTVFAPQGYTDLWSANPIYNVIGRATNINILEGCYFKTTADRVSRYPFFGQTAFRATVHDHYGTLGTLGTGKISTTDIEYIGRATPVFRR